MEDAYIIKGGNPVRGSVKLSGAKNASLKAIIASLLFEGEVVLENVPVINDVKELIHLVKLLGVKAEFKSENTLHIDTTNLNQNKVDLLHGSNIRVSFMLFAPLLYKFGQCEVPNPGGCRIGARPIDRIVSGMKSLGVEVEYISETGYYSAKMKRKPSGKFFFEKPSHTGTELLIMLSVFGKDQIIIENAALEPEIDELIKFLNEGGAKIQRQNSKIIISPVNKLVQKKPFSIISDRNEAVTFASLAIAAEGDIIVSPINHQSIINFINALKQIGAGVNIMSDTHIRFYYKSKVKSMNVSTSPHPGFMTDWQPNWAIIMTQANGSSIIHERVFENRFSYVEELRKLGADIEYVKLPVKDPFKYFYFNYDSLKKYNQAIKIIGPQKLHGGVMKISDLRAGATIAIAGLIAEGTSVVNGASIMERGYENFVKKVSAIGGEIKKV